MGKQVGAYFSWQVTEGRILLKYLPQQLLARYLYTKHPTWKINVICREKEVDEQASVRGEQKTGPGGKLGVPLGEPPSAPSWVDTGAPTCP